MLGLKLATDPRWVDIAQKDIGEILTDHAYCEQKAASQCISLIVGYPEKEKLVEMLTPVVAEEWSHFERVLEELKKRNLKFGKQRKDDYVVKLRGLMRMGSKKQLLDHLLVMALIEARSCERFKLLWKNIADEGLQKFYYELMVSEAGHYTNFIELANEYFPEEEVKERLDEMLAAEAEIISTMEWRPDRVH